jgi:2-oxoglutarate dehydrogenase complex dehydrogenase (E1) component-like enzyme
LEGREASLHTEEISEDTEADYELVSEMMDEVIPKATEKHLDDYEQTSEITEDKKPVETYHIEEIQRISRLITGYKHQRLCFYSSVIEPLHDEDLFQVETYNHGTFRVTKAQFHQHFPNVVKSGSYKEHGMYHYPTVPGKALPFKIKKLE